MASAQFPTRSAALKTNLWYFFCLAFFQVISGHGMANTILDFESPLPGGLTATSYIQGTTVPTTAVVGDNFLNFGVRVSGGALVSAGFGHAASGSNALAGISGQAIDYDSPVSFYFYADASGQVPGLTDFFSYAPDLGGGSGNIITISAFDVLGQMVGQRSFVETGTFTTPLSISGVGDFHRITVDQTLYNTFSGGIAIDLIQFADVRIAAVSAPGSMFLVLLSLAFLVASVRLSKSITVAAELSEGPKAALGWRATWGS